MESFTAVFDGKVFVPEAPVDLEPNVRVRVIVDEAETIEGAKARRREALEWFRNNPVHGPGFDWADLDRGDLYP